MIPRRLLRFHFPISTIDESDGKRKFKGFLTAKDKDEALRIARSLGLDNPKIDGHGIPLALSEIRSKKWNDARWKKIIGDKQ